MKKLQLVLTSILLMTCQLGMAQLERGNLIIGGTAGFDIQFEDDDDNLLTIALNPTVASFIDDNIAFGGSLGWVYQKIGDNSSSFFNILPLVRYYFPGANERSAFFLEGRAGLTIFSRNFGTNNDSSSAFQYSFGPGVAIFLSDDVSIDAILAYNRIGGDFDQSNIGLSIGINVFFIELKE